MQFWCSARDTAWHWGWQAYPGVWLFLALLVLGASRWNRAAAARSGTVAPPLHPLFLVGIIVLWLALDWPIGALGAGYLASVHMLQFLLIALVAPPCLLRGPSPEALAMLERPSAGARLVRQLTAPLPALILFNVIVLATHLPALVDGLMRTQLGSMLIDLLWLGAGLAFWWSIVAPHPERPRFPPPLRMLYLIGGLMFSPVMFGVVGFLVYSERPLYGIYELAPPVSQLSSRDDHQIAGVLMSVGGATIAFIALSVIFWRWSAKEG